MSEMNQFTPELYELEDELGNKKDFEMVDALEIDGQQYFAMLPAYDDEKSIVENLISDDGTLAILKTEEVNGEEYLVSLLDDDEYIRVSEIFLKRLQNLYEPDDDDNPEDDSDFVCGCDFDED